MANFQLNSSAEIAVTKNSGDNTVTLSVDEIPIANVTDLQTTLNNLQTTLNGKSDDGHGHTIANVTDLQTTLDGKAATSHSHTIANITDLQTTLDGKSIENGTVIISNFVSPPIGLVILSGQYALIKDGNKRVLILQFQYHLPDFPPVGGTTAVTFNLQSIELRLAHTDTGSGLAFSLANPPVIVGRISYHSSNQNYLELNIQEGQLGEVSATFYCEVP